MAKKSQFLAQIKVFGVCGFVCTPPTLFTVRWTQIKNVLNAPKSYNTCFRAAGTEKNLFLPENGQKMPIFAPNQCFLCLWCQFVPSPPYFEVTGHEEHVWHPPVVSLYLFQGRQHQKKGNFYPKMAKKMPILGPNQCFLGLEGQSGPPLP